MFTQSVKFLECKHAFTDYLVQAMRPFKCCVLEAICFQIIVTNTWSHSASVSDSLSQEDMISRLTEIGKCHGMEMNVTKSKVMRISKQPFPVQIMTDQIHLENVE
jgi:hypothetical protein